MSIQDLLNELDKEKLRIFSSIEKNIVGFWIQDKKDNTIHHVIGMTSNSYEIFHYAKTEQGVNCTQWYTEKDFKNQFKILTK